MQDPLSEVLLIVIGSSIIIFLLAGTIIFALLVSQKRKFLYAKKITDIQHNFEQEVLKTQVETHVQTLETISQELHDNVGTMVSIAIVHLKTFTQSNAATSTDRSGLTESQNILEEALDVLRDISRSINPDNITRHGLAHAFKNEIELIRRTKSLNATYDITGNEYQIPVQHQVIIFRIVQEAVNNILKHANASQLTFMADFHEPKLNVIIRDNGKGFQPSETAGGRSKSSGLSNMKKRASIINGTLDITSEQGLGTEVRFSYSRAV
jgi:two-component system, NarL family, sensor kinase